METNIETADASPGSLHPVVTRQSPRFIPMETPPDEHRERHERDPLRTKWWYDTWRPLTVDEQFKTEPPGQRYVAVETYADKNPNNYRHIEPEMCLLFTDQAEYYVVCRDCRSVYGSMQWSGGTRNPNWRQDSEDDRQLHQRTKGWCQFCDPIFGNGGWSLR